MPASLLSNYVIYMVVGAQIANIISFENTVGILCNRLYSGENHRRNGKDS